MSFQINSFDFANKTICLSKKKTISNDHTFTIITGKNAVGKSRLLTSIVTHYLRNSDSHSLFSEITLKELLRFQILITINSH
jgi:AAA15 family ATPase/GTPase